MSEYVVDQLVYDPLSILPGDSLLTGEPVADLLLNSCANGLGVELRVVQLTAELLDQGEVNAVLEFGERQGGPVRAFLATLRVVVLGESLVELHDPS
jgi:hypothetical protein